MLLGTAVLAVTITVPFVSVQNVPVATIATDHGQMHLVIDSGSNATFFTGRAARDYQEVCIDSCVCVPVEDISDSVPAFRKLVKGQKLIVDGLLGNDVLSHFNSVTIDYKRHTITFELP